LLLEADQQLPQEPRKFGLLLLREWSKHSSLGLEVTRSNSFHDGSPSPSQRNQDSSAVVRVGDAFDKALLLQAVDEVRHPAGCAHQGAVQLRRGTPKRGSRAAEGSQRIPARSVQAEACEVLVQTTIEQSTGAPDPSYDRDRGGVETRRFLPPLRKYTVDMVAA
jgi:hypothetical protein